MSHNQSRVERTESSQYRKSGRSNQHRNFTGGGTKISGSGGGATAPPPSSSTNNVNTNYPSLSSRGFKKHNNVQGGQSRATALSVQPVNSDSNIHSAPGAVQNGDHAQQPSHGASDAPITSSAIKPATVKATDMATQKAPRAPRVTPNISATNSDSKPPPTPVRPAKAPVEASRSFQLQFGSISPGLMNGMQVPARTSSAPPNLDEQKRDQARHDSLRAPPMLPIPSVPKQQFPKKDPKTVDQSNIAEVHPTAKPKREMQVSAAPPVSQTQKPSVHPIQGMPMQMPFHQPQVPVQFGPNPQIQSQAMSATSLSMPMPMPLAIGNSPVQPPVFVSGLQHHPIPSQGIMHQGQNLNFTSQMGPQLAPQLGNIGISMAPQFPQQQAGKFSGVRKAVKITHPDTHEELRLDGSTGPRSHPNVPPQSQHISSFQPTHQINYYPNPGSYNASSLFFPAPSSLPHNSSHPPTSQPPRFFNQVTVKPPASSHVEKDPTSLVSSAGAAKGESLKFSRPSQDSEISSQTSQKHLKPGLGQTSMSVPVASKAAVPSGSDSVLSPAPNSLSTASVVPEKDSSAEPITSEVLKQEIIGQPDSAKDENKKLGSRGEHKVLDQVGEQSVFTLSLPNLEPEILEGKADLTSMVQEICRESVPTDIVAESDAFDLNRDRVEESKTSESSKIFGGAVNDNPLKSEAPGKGEVTLSEDLKHDNKGFETSVESLSLDVSEVTGQTVESSLLKGTTISNELHSMESLETVQRKLEQFAGLGTQNDSGMDSLAERSTSMPDDGNRETAFSVVGTAEDNTSSLDSTLSRPEAVYTEDVTGSAVSDRESMSVSIPSYPEENLKYEDEGVETSNTGLVSPSSSVKEKSLPEYCVAKTTAPRGKKKRKELLKKLDNNAPTSDLYMAYKGPEENESAVISAEITESTSSNSLEPISSHVSQQDDSNEKVVQSKIEPDDWEDAADISTPKLETSETGNQVVGSGEDGSGLMTKKYSRDFLLKFAEQCTDLPEGFKFADDVAEALMVSNINISRDSYTSSARVIDRPSTSSRPDRRGSAMGDEDKWSKLPGPLMIGRDMRMDIGYGANMVGFRPGQVPNYGVLRNPRIQEPIQYPGGILAGPMPSLGPQVGMPRNSPDSERWQRATAFQKGLMPSPQTPLQIMHKAEKKYEVGKVTDEEEAKQRQLKAILNKLTPQNFEKLFEQVKQVNVDNAVTLTGVISQIFDKALTEPTFCEMYANFCYHLAAELPDLCVDNKKITFKRLLLNKCQEEFERGEREEEEANKVDEEGEVKQTEAEREEKRLKARRRMLGNIRLIGELYKKKMLTERIMHECIKKLLGQYQNPDEEDVEALCKLMSTIGEMIDHPKAKEHMDAYFDMMAKLSNNMKLSSRVRFMLKDAIDLRKNKWQQRRKVEGPKKIEEVHRDAAQERQAQASRLARTPSIGSSLRRGQPADFSPRGSNVLASPSSQMGGFRALPPQLRGYGGQDARMDERHVLENRILSVPLPQRPLGDDSITLGPQGGLARGMSFRGQPPSPGLPLADIPSTGDSRRMGVGLNGYNPIADRTAYNTREELWPRQMSDRFVSASVYDQSSIQERNVTYESKDNRSTDRSFDRSHPVSPPTRVGPQNFTNSVPSEKVWPEDRLQDMSMAAIKEFYSAKDESEVGLCIKDLNNPSFYPSMIALWVTDSFERKDMERDLLAKLLINLTKSRDGLISQDQLTRGFESVLMTLEDAMNDAPKAAEFLGRIFAKVILENVVPLSEIGRLIYDGGEEQGRLVEIGLAAEVLGTILEIITSERGGSIVTEIRSSSNLRLENFRPPGSNKSWRLDKFI